MTNNYNNLSESFRNNGTLLSNNFQNNSGNVKENGLPRLGAKKKSTGLRKSVSFNNNISITRVESWKKYNKDVSEETELFKLKQQIKEFKAQKAKKLKEQNECCCILF